MSLTKQPLKLGNPGLVLAPVAIEAVRSFVILGQFISLPAGKTGLDAVLAGFTPLSCVHASEQPAPPGGPLDLWRPCNL